MSAPIVRSLELTDEELFALGTLLEYQGTTAAHEAMLRRLSRPPRPGIVVHFTPRELGAVSEAVRYSQENHEENSGRPDATLSRVQRKLGDEVGAG